MNIIIPRQVDAWLDCGNKRATVDTYNFMENKRLLSQSSTTNTILIEPMCLAYNIEIVNAVISPHVSTGNNTKISKSRIQNSIVQKDSHIKNATFTNSRLDNFVTFGEKVIDLSVRDYYTITQF